MSYQFPPRLMKAKAAAHYLGYSESKLRALALPCKEDGGNVMYDKADLDAYADALPYRTEKRVQEWAKAFD
jgi:hypothetical protein